jgi:hypothetical protein
MNTFALNKTIIRLSLLCGVVIVGCATATPTVPATPLPTQPTQSGNIPFEIVAEGAPFVGNGQAPSAYAIRGDDPNRNVPNDLPDDGKLALKNSLSTSDASLYLVIYGGRQPSGGYAVRINSVTMRGNQLVVNYTLDKPKPGQGAATVLTHPYAIARVRNVSLPANAVVFEQQQ